MVDHNVNHSTFLVHSLQTNIIGNSISINLILLTELYSLNKIDVVIIYKANSQILKKFKVITLGNRYGYAAPQLSQFFDWAEESDTEEREVGLEINLLGFT